MVMRFAKNTFKLWNLQCSKCKMVHNILAWDYDVPVNCRCGGVYLSAHGDVPQLVRGDPEPPRVRTDDPNVILDDLRWSDVRGG